MVDLITAAPGFIAAHGAQLLGGGLAFAGLAAAVAVARWRRRREYRRSQTRFGKF